MIGLDILREDKGQNNGYILNLSKGEMYGNNEVIKLTERKNLYLQEILIQEITREDILYQIWKKGRFAQQHIISKITELTNQILDLEEKYEMESILIPKNSRWSNMPKIKQFKKERALWKDALLELEQKKIQNEDKKESERQAKEIQNFFNNKQLYVEQQRYEHQLKEK